MKQAAIRDRRRVNAPNSVLRRLIERMGVGIGSRILFAGSEDDPLPRYLHGLGIDVWHFHEDAQRAAACGVLTFDRRGRAPVETNSGATRRFDAVFVSPLAAYEGSVFDGPALRTTASLLAAVRPGGRFVLFSGDSGWAGGNGPHSRECFVRHFRVFTENVAARPMEGSLRRLFSSRTEWTVVTQLPGTRVSRLEWLSRAEAALSSHPAPCCAAAPRSRIVDAA